MRIGFIGAGKVGFSLGKYFSENGMEITGYFSRSENSAREAAEFTDSEYFDSCEKLINASDAVFLTVPDGAILETYLAFPKDTLAGKRLCHCSGALSSDTAFPDIAKYKAKGTSIHPLFPVSSKTESYKELGSAFFCIEGDCAEEWSGILSGMGNPTRIISSDIKSRYHAACSVASNLVCGIMAESVRLLGQCGFTEKEALTALEPLAMSNIRHIFEVGAEKALTDPVERNDVSTVKKHIVSIDDETGLAVYKAVSRKLTEIAEKRHSESDYSEMNEILK